MPISERELKDLVAAGVIDAGTAERIAAHFKDAGAEPPRFDLTHTAYYLGALVVMSALGWFMNEAWARYGGWVLTLIARSEEHTSELQSRELISYAVFCLKKKKRT